MKRREIDYESARDYLNEILTFLRYIEESDDDFHKHMLRRKIEWREDKVREIMRGG